MTFRLEKKSTGAVLTKFHVVNSAGDICGSINVANGQVNDLLKHWRQPAPAASTAGHARAVSAISNALRKGPRLSGQAARQAVLRGC
jgi:hypothetical protein